VAGVVVWSVFGLLREEREGWGDGVVELDDEDEADAPVGADDAEGGSEGVEALGEDDAAAEGAADLEGNVVFEEVVAGGVAPTDVEEESGEEDVKPVDEEGGAVDDELGQQLGREGHEGDGGEEGDVNPGEVAIGAGNVVELGLLTVPEDAEGEEAHEVHEELRDEGHEGEPEAALGVDGLAEWRVEIEDEEGHGDGEDSVAEGGEALEVLVGDPVIEGGHGRRS